MTRAKVAPRRPGYDAMWLYFGLSYASWLTLPRVLIHEMPDKWQARLAKLMKEWDETWDTNDCPMPTVSAKQGRRFTRWPPWVLNYRHPDQRAIARHRRRRR